MDFLTRLAGAEQRDAVKASPLKAKSGLMPEEVPVAVPMQLEAESSTATPERTGGASPMNSSQASPADSAAGKKRAGPPAADGSTSKRAQTRAKTPTPARPGAKAAATPGSKAATPSGGGSSKATATSKAAAAAKPPAAPPPSKQASTKPPTTAQLKEYGFKVLGPIAAGAFSTVVRAQHLESKTECAVKTFAKCTGPEAEEHERELSVLRLISETRHAHIANLIAEYEVSARRVETVSQSSALACLCNKKTT